MNYNDTIEQGATFYRVVTLYSDATLSTPVNLTDKTPRATLMSAGGQFIANFGVAILGSVTGQIAWSMPRTTTATLEANRQYFYCIDLDDADGITTDRAMSGHITVKLGQVPA